MEKPDITHLLMEHMASTQADRVGVKDFPALLKKLAPLKNHAPDMYAHSMRVGCYSCWLASQEGLDQKFALHGGCAHDIGKCRIPDEVLHAEHFGDREREVMRDHPQFGYDMLLPTHPYSAYVAGLHHQFQPNPYGIELKDSAVWKLKLREAKRITQMAHLVATADYFDAFTTRYGLKTDDEIREEMSQFSQERVEWLIQVQFMVGVGEKFSTLVDQLRLVDET